jgi:uncharacterized protein
MSQPWYQEGLRFCCTRCGNCCTGEPGFVWVNEEEIEAIGKYVGQSPAEIEGLYTRPSRRGPTLREKANGDCVFFDRNKGCTIYPVRPRQCRTWPFWQSTASAPEAWQRTCEVCPGAGQGELISAEEITRRMNVIRL